MPNDTGGRRPSTGREAPFRYFVTRSSNPFATALLRLDANEGLDIWASQRMASDLNAAEGWLATGWPEVSRLIDGDEFVEIDAVEAERLQPAMVTSATLWVNPGSGCGRGWPTSRVLRPRRCDHGVVA
jgi:hypothetical protein